MTLGRHEGYRTPEHILEFCRMSDSDTVSSFEDRLKRSPVWFALTMIALGAVGGFGFNAMLNGSALFGGSAPKVDWQAEAKRSGWVDKALCPALPVVLRVLSPGSDATIEQSTAGFLRSDLIVNSSQSLPTANSVGYIVNAEGGTNFYVRFPYFSTNDDRMTFRQSTWELPMSFDKPTRITVWAFVIEDKNLLGPVYGTLEQIRSVSNTIIMSDKVSFNVTPQK
jgi:hypothetical protein